MMMKLFRNSYVTSMASACVTGVFVAFVILAVGKWLTAGLFLNSVRVPLYDASEPIQADPAKYSIGPNVDDETMGILPLSGSSSAGSSGKLIAQTFSVATSSISATSFLVVSLDASTSLPEKIIVEKDSLRAVPIASLTKLATAVVAENLLDATAEITITPQILATYGGDPGNLRNGEQMTVEELLYPLLMVSSNDAGEALAQSYAPGRTWFIKAMNDWAYSIGAYNTYFADPTGLSPENVSSAHDLAIMLAWIYTHRPDLVTITATKVKYLGSHTWTSPTQLLNLSSYVAGKNGYLPEAGQTSVSLFNLNAPLSPKKVPELYIIVALGSLHRDQDVLSLLQKI
jgi:D-alanyl-D-alanine carboxypeptidase